MFEKRGDDFIKKKEIEESSQLNLVNINNFIDEEEIIDINSDKYKKIMFLYNSAIKQVNTQIEILRDELVEFYEYSPIEDITYRIKKPKSIIEKLNRKNYALTYYNLINNLNDVAGIRIICNFKDDVYKIVNLIENFQNIRIIRKKDYIANPKKSGYRAVHLVTEVPINFSKGLIFIKVEIQIKTLGMNFWAVLEHKLKYKNINVSKYDQKKLIKYADIINKMDDKLLMLSEKDLKENKDNLTINVIK